MEEPVKVLYVNGGIMRRGGIEAFMMNYFRHIDKKKVHIDFVVHGYEKGVYDDDIIAAGSKIYHVPTKSKHPIQYRKELRKIFSSGEYKIVHSHLDAMSGWVLKIAAQNRVPVRIAHSHNTDYLTQNRAKRFVQRMAMKDIHKFATDRFACSQMAGEWLFGGDNFEIIKNAIDVEKYRYSSCKRKELRDKFGVEDDFVIGHVGRFDYQKNQEFLIAVLSQLKKVKQNVKLVFIGDGETQLDVNRLAKQYDVYDDVLFLGSRQDVNELYNMMDVFVLPSRFEGLAVVAVEAQTNGLSCVLSSSISKEIKVSSGVHFLDIDNVSVWVEMINNLANTGRIETGIEDVIRAGYSIENEAEKLQKKYIELQRKYIEKAR